MSVAITIVSIALGALLAFSATAKLSHRAQVVEGYARAGVPERWLNLLAAVLLAAAAGVIAGLLWAPIGIAATAALSAYFVVAIGFHLRSGDAAHLPTPVLMLAIAAAALALYLVDA